MHARFSRISPGGISIKHHHPYGIPEDSENYHQYFLRDRKCSLYSTPDLLQGPPKEVRGKVFGSDIGALWETSRSLKYAQKIML